MITGDYKEPAFAIAKELGMAESIDEAMMGDELNKLSDEELREVVKRLRSLLGYHLNIRLGSLQP